jgi:hypothetical protein
MADGRAFTDYRTRCSQNQFLKERAQLPSSYDFRMFMMRNADALMTEDRSSAYKENKCAPCYDVNSDGTMLPEQDRIACDGRVCQVQSVNEAGLGRGRQYLTQSTDVSQPVAPGFVPARVSSSGFYPIGGLSGSDSDMFGAPL